MNSHMSLDSGPGTPTRDLAQKGIPQKEEGRKGGRQRMGGKQKSPWGVGFEASHQGGSGRGATPRGQLRSCFPGGLLGVAAHFPTCQNTLARWRRKDSPSLGGLCEFRETLDQIHGTLLVRPDPVSLDYNGHPNAPSPSKQASTSCPACPLRSSTPCYCPVWKTVLEGSPWSPRQHQSGLVSGTTLPHKPHGSAGIEFPSPQNLSPRLILTPRQALGRGSGAVGQTLLLFRAKARAL